MSRLKQNEQFKEEIVVNTKKVYDSCATKDYIENLRCYFTDSGQSIIDQSFGAKIKKSSILDVVINVEPITFRRGHFSIEENFYFEIELDALHAQSNVNLRSLCTYRKNMNMFGSESDIQTFSSQGTNINSLPNAIVQVSSPIVLDSSLNDVVYAENIGQIPKIPNEITRHFGSNLSYINASKILNVTIGLFAITHLERYVQVLIPSYDFVKPKKECRQNINSREEFEKMNFPVDNFFPPFMHCCSFD